MLLLFILQVTVLPFTKLLGEPKASTRVDQTVSKSRKSSSRKNISEDISKQKKGKIYIVVNCVMRSNVV